MNLIDKIYTEFPYYGSRRIKCELLRSDKIIANRKHIQRLMREMGIEAIYPKKKYNLSDPDNLHKKYPYLLRNFTTSRPNQVWGTDITYLKLSRGFAYLTAIMDWFSRYVIAWEVSNSLEINFVLQNLENALETNTPEIHNSDQGSHFTSSQYTGTLEQNNIQISMDSRGRCMDNIFTERLWRSVKYEDIYIKSYNNSQEARIGLGDYFYKYNNRRPHQSLGNLTPAEVYFNKII
jgi:putative transposase